MKHILKGVMAFAVCFLLVQCRKPNMDGWSHVGHTETIEFTTDYGGGKGNFTDANAALKYNWDIDNSDGKTDRLLVYAQGGDVTTFTHGTYLGSIPIVKVDPSDPCKATFRGVLGKVPEKGVLRFVHVGQSVSVNKGAADISFANQDGSMETISGKIIAVCDKAYTKISSFDGGQLILQYAICKLDMSGFSAAVGNKVDMSCIDDNGISINADGTISYTSGTYSNLNGVTAASTQYYIVMMPVNDNIRNIVLSCKDSSGRILTSKDLKAVFNANGFYTKPDGSGNPSGESYAPTVAQSVPGLLPGVFTVGSGKSVHFTQGNLWCNATNINTTARTADCEWHLENSQMDANVYGSDYQPEHLSHLSYSNDPFYAIVNGHIDYTPLNDDYTILENEKVPFTNATEEEPKSDFTVKVGESDNVTGLFRLLSKDEVDYMLNIRKVKVNNIEKLPYGVATVGGAVDGCVILPDNWDGTKCSNFVYGFTTKYQEIDESTWNDMEAAGAVFLPAAGYRSKDFAGFYDGKRGLYMTSTAIFNSSEYTNRMDKYHCNYLNFWHYDYANGIMSHARYHGICIRLVCDSKNI